MQKIFSLSVLSLALFCSHSFGQQSMTELLARQFHQAWNAENINEMVSLLQPDAFFKSPHQLQYGREKMKATVLKTNPPVYKVVYIKELHSRVHNDIAWSIGEFKCDIYDDNGNKTKEQLEGTYTYVFTKKNRGDWKVQMLIYHE